MKKSLYTILFCLAMLSTAHAQTAPKATKASLASEQTPFGNTIAPRPANALVPPVLASDALVPAAPAGRPAAPAQPLARPVEGTVVPLLPELLSNQGLH